MHVGQAELWGCPPKAGLPSPLEAASIHVDDIVAGRIKEAQDPGSYLTTSSTRRNGGRAACVVDDLGAEAASILDRFSTFNKGATAPSKLPTPAPRAPPGQSMTRAGADLMVLLMKAGLPNSELLATTGDVALSQLAVRHGVNLPLHLQHLPTMPQHTRKEIAERELLAANTEALERAKTSPQASKQAGEAAVSKERPGRKNETGKKPNDKKAKLLQKKTARALKAKTESASATEDGLVGRMAW